MNDKARTQTAPELYNTDNIEKIKNGCLDGTQTKWIYRVGSSYPSNTTTEKLIYNSPTVNFAFDPCIGGKFEINPNKVIGYRPAKDETASFKDVQKAFEQATEELLEAGLECPNFLTKGKLFAYHNAFDIETDCPYSNYEPIFKISGGSSTDPTARRQREEKGTQYFSTNTGNTVLTVYNKTAESELLYNCIRHELRHDKFRKILMSSVNESFYLQTRQKDHARIMRMLYNGIDEKYVGTWLSYLAHTGANNKLSKRNLAEIGCIVTSQDPTALRILQTLHRNARGNDKRNIRYVLNALSPWQLFTDNFLLERYNELKTKFSAVA